MMHLAKIDQPHLTLQPIAHLITTGLKNIMFACGNVEVVAQYMNCITTLHSWLQGNPQHDELKAKIECFSEMSSMWENEGR